MRLIPPSRLWPIRRDVLERRAVGITLAIIIHVLGFFLLLSLTPQTFRLERPELKSFPLLSLSEKPAPKPAATSSARRSKPVPPPPPPTTPPPPPAPLNMMIVSSEVFRASDISRIHPQRSQDNPVDGAAPGEEVAQGPGEGPGGEKLYPADWYVEPTPAEMAFYLKGRRQAGWAMIACRTVPNFRVEDCRELDEFPHGSGLSSALRQAAWQFRIRPPRIGGKPQMGVWVRILFDFQIGVMK